MRGLRKKIAEKMTLSEDHAVPFTFVEECDVTNLSEARERLNKSGLEVPFLPFLMKATAPAMKQLPPLHPAFHAQRVGVLRKAKI